MLYAKNVTATHSNWPTSFVQYGRRCFFFNQLYSFFAVVCRGVSESDCARQPASY